MQRELTEHEKLCRKVWSSAFNAGAANKNTYHPEDAEKFADYALEKFKLNFLDTNPPPEIHP